MMRTVQYPPTIPGEGTQNFGKGNEGVRTSRWPRSHGSVGEKSPVETGAFCPPVSGFPTVGVMFYAENLTLVCISGGWLQTATFFHSP
jgi:hypothetical protein